MVQYDDEHSGPLDDTRSVHVIRCSCCKKRFKVFAAVTLVHDEGNAYTLECELFPLARAGDWPPHGTRVRQSPQYMTGSQMLRDPEINWIERHPDTPCPPMKRRESDDKTEEVKEPVQANPRLTRRQEAAKEELDGRLENRLVINQGDKREFRDTDPQTLNEILRKD